MAALGYDLRNVASTPGAGSAAGFNQAAMGAGTGVTRVNTIVVPIAIVDSKSGNVLSQNSVVIENGKTASNVNYKSPLATRPNA